MAPREVAERPRYHRAWRLDSVPFLWDVAFPTKPERAHEGATESELRSVVGRVFRTRSPFGGNVSALADLAQRRLGVARVPKCPPRLRLGLIRG